MRDLSRSREDAIKAQRVARQLLGAFLLRHGLRYPGKQSRTPAHMRLIVGHHHAASGAADYAPGIHSCDHKEY